MTDRDRKLLQQWQRYEFIRDYGLENAEKDTTACAREMVLAGLFHDGRGMRGIVNGIKTICREMRSGWKPQPIYASHDDVMRVLSSKIASEPANCINLSLEESAVLWSAVQKWRRGRADSQ